METEHVDDPLLLKADPWSRPRLSNENVLENVEDNLSVKERIRQAGRQRVMQDDKPPKSQIPRGLRHHPQQTQFDKV